MILIIFGEENFLSLKKLIQMKERFIFDNKNVAEITEYDEKNFDIQDFQKKSLTISFFEEKRLFILKNILTKKLTEKEAESIANICLNAPETSLIVFFEYGKLDNKATLLKKIKEKTKKTWEFKKLTAQQVLSWARKEINNRGSSIKNDALENLVSITNSNLWLIDHEIEKLTLYKQKKEIKIADIDKTFQKDIQSNIFSFIENIGKKNKRKALTELNKLIVSGEEPIYILRMIIYQVRIMLIVKSLLENNFKKSGITSITKKHPFVITKTIEQASLFTIKELKEIYNRVFDLEISIKRGTQNPEKSLIFFTAKSC